MVKYVPVPQRATRFVHPVFLVASACNPSSLSLQPYVSQPATLCISQAQDEQPHVGQTAGYRLHDGTDFNRDKNGAAPA
mgnify:CR=1 FL=1